MANAWSDKFLTSILQLVTDKIVMWETLEQNANWVYFISLCIFGSRTFCSNNLGLARNKQLCHTIAPKQILSHLTLN